MQRKVITVLSIAILFFLVRVPMVAAGAGSISGFVRDAQTGDGLPGANVLIAGTSIGASTDLNGRFLLQNIAPGAYTVRVTYIGYRTKEIQQTVVADEEVKVSFSLSAVAIEGSEVVVTAQARVKMLQSISRSHQIRSSMSSPPQRFRSFPTRMLPNRSHGFRASPCCGTAARERKSLFAGWPLSSIKFRSTASKCPRPIRTTEARI